MSCLIAASNVKIFGKAFHSLVRVADDLYIEALPSGLVFHTVNTSKSAYACFTFKKDFFISYEEDGSERRKILIKSCLMAFRTLQVLDKTVEKCLFDLTASPDYLLLKFFCKHGMIKVYQLNFVENESVHGQFPTSGFLCKLNASSRLLHDGMHNFSNSVEEISLTVCSSKVLLRNYVDDEPDPNKVVHTELTLESGEFDCFEVDQDSTVTFCLKEFKAVLTFCEGLNVPVTIQCQTPGRPVTITINGVRGLEVRFVLATIADSNSQQSVSSVGSIVRSQTSQAKKGRTEHNSLPITKNSNSSIENGHSSSNPESIRSSPSIAVRKSFGDHSVIKLSDDEDDTDPSLLINAPQNYNDYVDDDFVPSTPPHKKFKREFLGLSQATYTSMAPDPDEVLALNSDDES